MLIDPWDQLLYCLSSIHVVILVIPLVVCRVKCLVCIHLSLCRVNQFKCNLTVHGVKYLTQLDVCNFNEHGVL